MIENRTQRAKILLAALLVGIASSIFYLSSIDLTDPFFYRVIASADATLQWGYLSDPYGHPRGLDFGGYTLIIAIVAAILGVPAMTVQFLPIGAFVVAAIWAVVVSQFTTDYRVIGGFTAPIILVPSYITGHYATFAYAWSRVLYFTALLCLVLLFKSQYDFAYRRRVLIVLLTIGFGLLNIYWTATGWLVLNLGFLAIGLYAIQDDRYTEAWTAGAVLLGLFLLIPTILHQLVAIFASGQYGTPIEGLQGFFTMVMQLFGGGEQSDSIRAASTETSSIKQVGNLLWNMSRIGRYMLVFGAVGVSGLVYLHQLTTRKRSPSWATALVLSLGMTALMHSLIYLARGNFSLRYASVIFPIVFLLLMGELNRPRATLTVAIGLLAISVVGFGGYVAVQGQETVGSYDQTEDGAEWLTMHTSNNPRVLSDFHSVDGIQAQSIGSGNVITPVYYSEERYRLVVFGGGVPPDTEYVVINTARHEQDVGTIGWNSFPPFQAHTAELGLGITATPGAKQVYSDGDVEIYRV